MPFSFHMHMLDAISGVQRRLHYFDRYLKPNFYELYLRNLDRSLEICLVTTLGQTTLRNSYGVAAVTAVSDLFRQESTNYRLIQISPNDMHDRNLRVDDQVFTLGTSATEAGRQPTHFGPVANAHQTLDDLIAKGKVIHQS